MPPADSKRRRAIAAATLFVSATTILAMSVFLIVFGCREMATAVLARSASSSVVSAVPVPLE